MASQGHKNRIVKVRKMGTTEIVEKRGNILLGVKFTRGKCSSKGPNRILTKKMKQLLRQINQKGNSFRVKEDGYWTKQWEPKKSTNTIV